MSQVLLQSQSEHSVDTADLTVGSRIAAALADSGLTQAALARQLMGADADASRVESMRRLLNKWVRDQHAPSADYASRLAEIFGKPEGYFEGRSHLSPISAEDEKDALGLVWETAMSGTSTDDLKRLPASFDRKFIARALARDFPEEHILLDEVSSWVAGEVAVAKATLTKEVWRLGQWYENSRLIPGLLILEALAQTASVALLTATKYRRRIVLCAGYDNVRIRRPVEDGETLILHAKVRHLRGPIAHFDAWATKETDPETVVAAGLFTIVVH